MRTAKPCIPASVHLDIYRALPAWVLEREIAELAQFPDDAVAAFKLPLVQQALREATR